MQKIVVCAQSGICLVKFQGSPLGLGKITVGVEQSGLYSDYVWKPQEIQKEQSKSGLFRYNKGFDKTKFSRIHYFVLNKPTCATVANNHCKLTRMDGNFTKRM